MSAFATNDSTTMRVTTAAATKKLRGRVCGAAANVQSLSIALWEFNFEGVFFDERAPLQHVLARRSERAPVLCGYILNCGWRLGHSLSSEGCGGNAELKALVNHEQPHAAGDRRIMKGSHPKARVARKCTLCTATNAHVFIIRIYF